MARTFKGADKREVRNTRKAVKEFRTARKVTRPFGVIVEPLSL